MCVGDSRYLGRGTDPGVAHLESRKRREYSTALSLPVFILASIVARGLRFFLVAALLRAFGEPIRDFIERRLGLVFVAFCVLLLGGFFVVKYL